MTGFIAHIFFVLLCIGLGMVIQYAWHNIEVLDDQVARLRDGKGRSGMNPVGTSQVPRAMQDVKLKADPDKLKALKETMRG